MVNIAVATRNQEFENEVAIHGVYNQIDTRILAFRWSDAMAKWPSWVEEFYHHGGILSDAAGYFYAKTNNSSFERLEEGEWLMLNRFGMMNSMPNEQFEVTYQKMKI